MDNQLKRALEFSNYRQSFAIQRKTLKEKVESKLTYGFNGGIFKIDRSLITFVQMLLDQGRTSGVPLLDSNDNPILVDNLSEFKDEILDRYYTATLEYFNEYQKLKKARSVDTIINL